MNDLTWEELPIGTIFFTHNGIQKYKILKKCDGYFIVKNIFRNTCDQFHYSVAKKSKVKDEYWNYKLPKLEPLTEVEFLDAIKENFKDG